MSIRVLNPGMATSIQAGPRNGLRHLGVPATGALDPYSHAIANLLVGNPPGSPALEATLAGPTLHFRDATRIALCGGRMEAEVDGTILPPWRPVLLPAGATLRLGQCRSGARTYLAVAGGFAVPEVLGSRSTDLRTGFGGFAGRCLARGDVLEVARAVPIESAGLEVGDWWIDPTPDIDLERSPCPVRILSGGSDLAPPEELIHGQWAVMAASNRQGLRLKGPVMQTMHGDLLPSEPVAPGTIQLPPDGQPIVLLADAQTHGGYPRIGHVIRADRPRLAQLRPGDSLRFVPCTPEQAHLALRGQRQRLQRIALAIEARSRTHA